MATGDVQKRLASMTGDVLAQEDEHYTWARDTRARWLLTLAGAAPTQADMASEATGSTVEYRTLEQRGIPVEDQFRN